MKLTHENVRAALANAIATASVIDCTDAATFVLLAEEWLARHTLRWDGRRLVLLNGREFGFVAETIRDKWGSCALAIGAGRDCDTEAQARTWLEEQARVEGYEIER